MNGTIQFLAQAKADRSEALQVGAYKEPSDAISVVDPAVIFAVKVWWDGGGTTDGDSSNKCDRTYLVKTLDSLDPIVGGVELGTGMEPQKRRPFYGPLDVVPSDGTGQVGLGYYDMSGDFQLYDANETLQTGACN